VYSQKKFWFVGFNLWWFSLKLSKDGTEITGEIPTELGKLSGLKAFKISGGSLSGSIPTEIGLLNGLINLDFGKESL